MTSPLKYENCGSGPERLVKSGRDVGEQAHGRQPGASGKERAVHLLLAAVLFSTLLLLAACTTQTGGPQTPEPLQVSLTVSGELYNLTTDAANVRELLEEAGISTEAADEISPPPFTPLQDGMSVSVMRVSEEIEVMEESLPFSRKIVRSEAMNADDPPRIIQGGRSGLQEITVRVVYHDGEEVDRQRTRVTILEEPQDEILMVGVGATPGSISFAGTIAYMSGGSSVIMRGSTAYPEQLNTGDNVDGRVFSLSPTGEYLLYTRVTSDTSRFNNSLWLLSTERDAEPQPVGVENVLWADWNPAREASLQIAYSTGNPVDQPPGWEANNDLWVATVYANEEYPFRPEEVVDVYPATYGWWGGNYSWSPDGRYIAYSYADEVGLVDLEARRQDEARIQLYSFTEYNTGAEWVWVPTPSWSPDSRFVTFATHGTEDEQAMVFDVWVVDASGQVGGRFVSQAGMWSHPHWSPYNRAAEAAAEPGSYIAYLQATNPLDGLRSTYTLWLMDADGSNATQIYPARGENSYFSQERRFMAWGPTGRDIAFVFDEALYLYNLDAREAYRITQDDAPASRPTWAPYGAGIIEGIANTRIIPLNDADVDLKEYLPPEE